MGKVILDMAMSLDGYIAGPNDEELGLHDWFFAPGNSDHAGNQQIVADSLSRLGAIIIGRRTYDMGAQADGFLLNPYQCPHFVLTHRPPTEVARGNTTFIFVTDGIHSALRQARAAAGNRDVAIGGGASTAQQFLKARLIDELHIHLAPVLLGEGVCLFDPLETTYARLHHKAVVAGAGAVHLAMSM